MHDMACILLMLWRSFEHSSFEGDMFVFLIIKKMLFTIAALA